MTMDKCKALAITPAKKPNFPAKDASIVQKNAANNGLGSECGQILGIQNKKTPSITYTI
jgi:hypothetical protein